MLLLHRFCALLAQRPYHDALFSGTNVARVRCKLYNVIRKCSIINAQVTIRVSFQRRLYFRFSGSWKALRKSLKTASGSLKILQSHYAERERERGHKYSQKVVSSSLRVTIFTFCFQYIILEIYLNQPLRLKKD